MLSKFQRIILCKIYKSKFTEIKQKSKAEKSKGKYKHENLKSVVLIKYQDYMKDQNTS